jgi:uncharacterized damage-inducible protein DinB
MVRLETVLDTWKSVRRDTVQALEDMPADALDFRATPDLMTFRELARHILDAGNGLVGLLLDGVDNLQTPEFRPMLKKYASTLPDDCDSAALAAELTDTLEANSAKLAGQTADFYRQEITRFDGVKVTRLEMLQFVKEHELTHRSQMFLYLRLKGVTPPTTRRRQAAAKR